MLKNSMLGRRALIAACVAVPAVVAGGGAALAEQPKTALPVGMKRGSVAETDEDGTKIYEVLDGEGNVVGYTFDEEKLRELSTAGAALDKEMSSGGDGAPQVQAASVSEVALCAAAIAGFVAMTVFPAARVARLAWRLGKLTAKYGPKLVARIFMGARGIAGRTVEKELIDLAKELTGVAALQACGL
ncbi:hypothetical protein [Brachybacterium hainanense]|uniref:Tat pathway signal sequence domain protein n=1 Tax=Brachybacterium hainanense TaxID=1541174 RepID=A0ABV6R9I3_9MICO